MATEGFFFFLSLALALFTEVREGLKKPTKDSGVPEVSYSEEL